MSLGNIILTLAYVFEFGLFLYYIIRLTNKKIDFKNPIYIFYFSVPLILQVLPNLGSITTVIGVLIFILYARFICDLKWLQAFLNTIIFVLLLMGCDLISVISIKALYSEIPFELLMTTDILIVQMTIISKLILLLIISIFVLIIPELYELNRKESYSILLISTVNIVVMVLFFYLNYDYEVTDIEVIEKTSPLILFVSLIVFISNIAVMFTFRSIIIHQKHEVEEIRLREKSQAKLNYYRDMEESYNSVRKVKHDLLNHLFVIKGFISHNQESALDYIEEITAILDKNEVIYNTGNEVLNILLSDIKGKMIKHDIDFQVVCDFSRCDFISMTDTCSLFSNALDNAIDACIKIENPDQRFASVKLSYVNDFAVIKFTNSFINDNKYVDGKLITTKPDKENHGIGLRSIENSVSNYCGDCVVNIKEGIFELIVRIPVDVE